MTSGSLINYQPHNIICRKTNDVPSIWNDFIGLPQLSTASILRSESCFLSVVKLRKRRDLISNCVDALCVAWLNAGMGKIIELNRVANLKIYFWILSWSNRLRQKEENFSIVRLWVQIRITEQNSKIVEFANFNFSK